jgi:DNA-binding beta-propeller fold protein YncE
MLLVGLITSALSTPRLLATQPLPPGQRVVATVAQTIAPPATTRPMHMPTDVAADSKVRIYVADGVNDRILRFSQDGTFEVQVSPGNAGPFHRPVGIFVDAHDDLWVADTGTRRLLTVHTDGSATATDLPVIDNARPDPTDVAVTPDGKRLYVVDNDNHRLLVRENSSGQWTGLGKTGRALGQFQWPFMIALDHEGYAYVTEAIGARVQSVSPSDKWAGEIGKWGVEPGHLYRPKGVACHPTSGEVFVSDSTLGVVQVFSARGRARGVLSNAAGTPLRFKHPMGLSFDSRGRLYVVELAADRVAVVQLQANE